MPRAMARQRNHSTFYHLAPYLNLWTLKGAIHGPETSVHWVPSVFSNEAGMEQATSKSLGESNPTDIWDGVQRAKTWPRLTPETTRYRRPIQAKQWRNP
jgi:hypothetical protein